MGAGRRAVLGSTVIVASFCQAAAQTPTDACALLGKDEFHSLTGKPEYTDPTLAPWSGGTLCAFANGHVSLLTAADSAEAMDRFLTVAVKVLVSARTPVEGLGEGAYSVLFDPDDPYQDHGAFVVFGAGPPTVAVAVYAEEGDPPSAALQPALAIAQAVAAKLP